MHVHGGDHPIKYPDVYSCNKPPYILTPNCKTEGRALLRNMHVMPSILILQILASCPNALHEIAQQSFITGSILCDWIGKLNYRGSGYWWHLVGTVSFVEPVDTGL